MLRTLTTEIALLAALAGPVSSQLTRNHSPHPPNNHMVFVGQPRIGWDCLLYPNTPIILQPQWGVFCVGSPVTPEIQLCPGPMAPPGPFMKIELTIPGNSLPLKIPNDPALVGFTLTFRHMYFENGECPNAIWTDELIMAVQA